MAEEWEVCLNCGAICFPQGEKKCFGCGSLDGQMEKFTLEDIMHIRDLILLYRLGKRISISIWFTNFDKVPTALIDELNPKPKKPTD